MKCLIQSARKAATQSVDLLQVITNFEIGCRIIEYEQSGEERAEYGKVLLKALSQSLTEEFGRGFSKSNLEYMRRFYLMYKDRRIPIAQTVSGQLDHIQSSLSNQQNPSSTRWQELSKQFNLS